MIFFPESVKSCIPRMKKEIH